MAECEIDGPVLVVTVNSCGSETCKPNCLKMKTRTDCEVFNKEIFLRSKNS